MTFFFFLTFSIIFSLQIPINLIYALFIYNDTKDKLVWKCYKTKCDFDVNFPPHIPWFIYLFLIIIYFKCCELLWNHSHLVWTVFFFFVVVVLALIFFQVMISVKGQVMKKSQCKIVLIWSSFFMQNKKFQSIPSVFFQSTLLSTLFRFFRRGSPSSPASGLLPSPQTKPPTPGSKGTPEGQEPFIQLVQAFVRHVQR